MTQRLATEKSTFDSENRALLTRFPAHDAWARASTRRTLDELKELKK